MIQVQLKRGKKLRLKTKLKEAYDKADGSSVTVGIHAEAGAYPARGASEPATVAEVANWMEFGTKKEDGTTIVPARSFMQSTANESAGLIAKLMDRMLVNIGWNNWTVEKALARIGSQFLRAVQNKVKSNVAPELGWSEGSKRYLARKLAAGNPARTLIASGKLLSSLTYKIQLTKGAQQEADAVRAAAAPATTATRSGSADSRARAREAGQAMIARAKQQRAAFKTDADKQARFAAQQATKGKN